MATIPLPTTNDPIDYTWGEAVADALNDSHFDAGYLPYCYPYGVEPTSATSTGNNLAAVSAGNAGGFLTYFCLPGPMRIQSVTIRNADTATARSAEFRLYRDVGSATLVEVSGTSGTISFTPSAASDRTGDVSTPGTLLTPGGYWLAVRNTSASQTFAYRRYADGTELAGNIGGLVTTASVPALSSTLNSALFSSLPDGAGAARLNGRVFGGSAAF